MFLKLQVTITNCQSCNQKQTVYSPPNDAATATEPATDPVAVAAAANPLAPIAGTREPKVGAKALNPAAIAGAARPVQEWSYIKISLKKKCNQNLFP